MKRTLCIGATAAAVLLAASVASAQTTLTTANLTATVIVGNQAKLTVGGGPITFADSDPDTVLNIPASGPVAVSARARVLPATQLNVTVRADAGYFDPGTDSIPVTGLTWTVGGAPFVGGTMDVTDQPLATWNGPASQNGTQNYTLANSWSYVPGTFSVTLTYTLSTP